MEEQDLRERLAGVAVPPSGVDVAGVVDAGRSRVRRRRVVQAVCGAALATGVLAAVPALVWGGSRPGTEVAAAPASLVCAGAELPLPAGVTNVHPSGVDARGRYVIGNDRQGGEDDSVYTPVLWTDGVARALPTGGRSVMATGVNTSGVVVGTAADETVVRYDAGRPTTLELPPGRWILRSYPAVNARGDVVATVTTPDKPTSYAAVLLWPAGSVTGVKLPLPANAVSMSVTDDGRIVGEVVTPPKYEGDMPPVENYTPYVWDQRGTGTELPTPAGTTATLTMTRGDWAAGQLWPGGVAARWNLRTGEVLPLDVEGSATGVNAYGWMIVDRKIVRPGGAGVDLAPVGGSTGVATVLSDTGVVVGSVMEKTVQWRCGQP